MGWQADIRMVGMKTGKLTIEPSRWNGGEMDNAATRQLTYYSSFLAIAMILVNTLSSGTE